MSMMQVLRADSGFSMPGALGWIRIKLQDFGLYARRLFEDRALFNVKQI